MLGFTQLLATRTLFHILLTDLVFFWSSSLAFHDNKNLATLITQLENFSSEKIFPFPYASRSSFWGEEGGEREKKSFHGVGCD